MPRLFFGLEIPESIKTSLLKVKTDIKGARWQSKTQLHLTLTFLGEVEAEQVIQARDNARKVAHTPFELEAAGLGCFGKEESPKILWAGVSPEAELRGLQRTLAQRLINDGFTLQNPSFKPHITLSRFRAGAGSVAGLIEHYQRTRFGSWPVQGFALFESSPGQSGSVYTVLERYPLTT